MTAQSIRPPGPKGRPIIGLFPEFRSDPAGFLLSVAQQHGDIAYLKLGHQHLYLLNRPEFVQDVLITHSSSFMKSRIMQRAKLLIGDGLLTNEGQSHLRQRRLVQPAFHRQRIADYATAMMECAVRAQSRWADGEVRDMAEEMMRLTLAIVGKTLFSADVESDAADIGRAMTDVLGLFDTMLLPFSNLLQKLPLPSTRRFQKAKEKLDRTIYGFIRERRSNGVDRGDLLSMLLLAVDEQGDGGGMTDKQVHDEALTLFLAGHETTANALTWTWYLLSRHPEVEARFHAEIAGVLEGRTPCFDDLPRLEYTERIFAESMRLYPPAWALARLALKDYRAGPYEIPAGSICVLSPYVMHRNPEYFPDPERFDPDRWIAGAREARPKYSYFPFGAGPRICIGERFAWTEGVLVLATIGQRWRMHLDPGQRVERLAQITLRTRYGMRMQLEARTR